MEIGPNTNTLTTVRIERAPVTSLFELEHKYREGWTDRARVLTREEFIRYLRQNQAASLRK